MFTRRSLLLLNLLLSACGAARASETPARAPGAPPNPTLQSVTAGESAPAADQPSSALVANAAPRATAATSSAAPAPRAEMLDIEANLNIEVSNVPAAARALRETARRFDAMVVEDVVEDRSEGASARLTLRVPGARTQSFLDSVGTLGLVRSRIVNARDVGKEYFDAELRLQNLQKTMQRYEEILERAKDVNEILRVEAELSRLRGEIEQIKGNLRYLQDRVARSTIHVYLTTAPKSVAEPAPAPQAKFYPGLRLVQLNELRGERGHEGYWGAGLSVMAMRAFGLQLDALRRSGAGLPTGGVDALLVTLGGETYSEFLGGGRRVWLNPYLGYNLGYARIRDNDHLMAGITLGTEIWRSKAALIDLQVRGFGLFFDEKAHVGVEPVLGVSFPF